MAGPDVVLFIVGALLFGGALTAIIVTQGPGAFTGPAAAATGVYTVSYPLAKTDLKSAVADFSGGAATLKVDKANVASVTVKIDCTDPAGQAVGFTITVNVDGPGGIKGKPATGVCGAKIEIPIHVQDVPPATSVAGNTPQDAQNSLPANPNATAGQGDWKVTYSGNRASPAGGPLPVPVPAGAPNGNVILTVETFAPKLDPVAK